MACNDIKYSLGGAISVLVFLPWILGTRNGFLFLVVISIYIIWMIAKEVPGYSMVLMSVCLCNPVLVMTGIDTQVVTNTFYQIHYFLFLQPVFMAIITLLKGKRIPYVQPLFLSLVYIVLGLSFGDQIYNYLYVIVCTHVIFYVCYYDKVSMDKMYLILSILFLITTIYTILEFHFGWGPYNSVYETSRSYHSSYSISRAVGLLGNPLLLCSVAVIVLVSSLNRTFRNKRFPILVVLLCIYIMLIVVSRIAVIALIGVFLFYYILSGNRRSLSRFLFLIALFVGAFLLAKYFFPDVLDNLLYRIRFSERGHRLSGIDTTINILSSNPFGLGSRDFGIKVLPYAGVGKEEGINTLDNFFLTQFAYYGILGFLMIYYYLFYFLRAFKYKTSCPEFFKQASLLFVGIILIGLSFDFEAYYHITIIVYGLLGILYSNYLRSPKPSLLKYD